MTSSWFAGTLRVSASCIVATAILLASVLSAHPASAQEYSFALDSELVDVHILKDGSIDIDYTFEFRNYGYMDGVDVGLSNKYHDAGSAYASIVVTGVTSSRAGRPRPS